MEEITFVFDIDGTVCPIKKEQESYEELVPFEEMVQKMRLYKSQGARIILYTSRNMHSYQGNLGLINAHTAPVLLDWLKKWDIPFDEIVYGKIWPGHHGYYVDDRTVRPDEFLNCSVAQLEELCSKSRCQGDDENR